MKLTIFAMLIACIPSFAQVCADVEGFEFCEGDTILTPGGLMNKLLYVYEQNRVLLGDVESVTAFGLPTGYLTRYNLRTLGTTKYCGPGVLASREVRVRGYSNRMRCIGYYPLAQNVAFEPLNRNAAIPRAIVVPLSEVAF